MHAYSCFLSGEICDLKYSKCIPDLDPRSHWHNLTLGNSNGQNLEGIQFSFTSDKPAGVGRIAVVAVEKFASVKGLIQQNPMFNKILQVKHNFNYFPKKE